LLKCELEENKFIKLSLFSNKRPSPNSIYFNILLK
jgi:hypothetical protein